MGAVQKTRFGCIDLLKFLLSICIVIHHYQLMTGAKFIINFAGEPFFDGSYLVELFFMISGYFALNSVNNQSCFFIFFIKKYFRLIPLCAISTIFSCFAKVLYKMQTDIWTVTKVTLWNIFIGAFGIQSGWFYFDTNHGINEHLWYVSVLLLCYIVLFFIYKLSERENINFVLLSFIVIITSIENRIVTFNFILFNSITCRGYIPFFIGVLLNKALTKLDEKQKSLLKKICFMIITVYVFFYTLSFILWKNSYFSYLDFYLDNQDKILSIIFFPALMIAILLLKSNKLDNRLIYYLGDCSFMIYVFHLPLIYVFMFINQKILVLRWESGLSISLLLTVIFLSSLIFNVLYITVLYQKVTIIRNSIILAINKEKNMHTNNMRAGGGYTLFAKSEIGCINSNAPSARVLAFCLKKRMKMKFLSARNVLRYIMQVQGFCLRKNPKKNLPTSFMTPKMLMRGSYAMKSRVIKIYYIPFAKKSDLQCRTKCS